MPISRVYKTKNLPTFCISNTKVKMCTLPKISGVLWHRLGRTSFKLTVYDILGGWLGLVFVLGGKVEPLGKSRREINVSQFFLGLQTQLGIVCLRFLHILYTFWSHLLHKMFAMKIWTHTEVFFRKCAATGPLKCGVAPFITSPATGGHHAQGNIGPSREMLMSRKVV